MCDILFYYIDIQHGLTCHENETAHLHSRNQKPKTKIKLFQPKSLAIDGRKKKKKKNGRVAFATMWKWRFKDFGTKTHHTSLLLKFEWEKSSIARILALLLLARKIHLKRRLWRRSRQVMHLFHVFMLYLWLLQRLYVHTFFRRLLAAFIYIWCCECRYFF